MPRVRNLLATMGVLAVAACGGGTEASPPSIVPTPTTEAPSSTTTEPTTTESTTTEPTTTTTTPPPPSEDEVAAGIVLPSGFFGEEWSEEARSESDFAYASIEGCEFVDGLTDADGNLAEAESPTFSQFDTEIEHDVRVYTSVGHATDVVLAWAEDATIQCLADGAESQAQADLDAGELEPFTEYAFEIQVFEDHIGEPRVTNIEIANTLTGPDVEVLVYVDVYFVQVGRTVSRLEIVNPDSPWSQSAELLEVIVERMASTDPAAGG